MDKKTILAIDVGTGMVKVLAGRLGADGSVALLGSGAAPTAGFLRGVVTEVDALAHSIKQAVECVVMASENHIAGSVYLGIGGTMLVAQDCLGTIALASSGTVTSADVERACKAAAFTVADGACEILHVLPIQESVAELGAALEVKAHIVSVSQIMLQSLTDALRANGIDVNGFVANGVMAAQGIKNELPCQSANYVFLDIGAGVANICVYVGGRLCSSASLPLGGDYITSDLMQGLGVSWAHAEEIKRYYSRLSPDLRYQGVVLDCNDYGTTDQHISFDFLSDIIESRVEEIVTLVYAYIKPLLEQHAADQGQGFDAIYLTGGCGSMPSVVTCAAKVFQMHAETVKPERLTAEYVHPANTVCYGIIKHGAKLMASEPMSEQSAWKLFVCKTRNLLQMWRN